MRLSADILVVGGGIVGAAASLALQRAGYKTLLIERADAPPVPPQPDRIDARVYAIAPSARRFLDSLGVWPPAAAPGPYTRMAIWDADPARALVFDAAEAGLPELGHIVAHDALLSALWNALDPQSLLCGVEIAGFEPGTCPQLCTEAGRRLSARLVIAADGGASRLRALAGLDTVGWDYAQQGLVCHVETEHAHQRTALQRFLPDGPLAFLPLADGRSSIVWSSTEAERLRALPDAAFCEQLAAAIGQRLGAIGACTPRLAFPLRMRHAQHYTAPGLALIGDAAHVIHPLAGQGLNLGLADAQALVETLARTQTARQAPGAPRVLARYARARKAANLEMIAVTDGLQRLFALRTPYWDGVRNLGLELVGQIAPLREALMRRALGV